MPAPRTLAALGLPWVLLLAAAYEAVLAFGWVSIGLVPGAGAPGEGATTAAAVGAMLVGAYVVVAFPTRVASLIPSAAALVMIARYYTFDPYYAPTLRRMSDGGLVAAWWIYALAGVAAASALARRLHPLAVVSLVLCILTLLAESAGH